jgi:5-methylcytosine-specific restriction protein B
MEPITQDDLNKIQHYAGQAPTDSSYDELTSIYSKLDYLCKRICQNDFEYSIRKDPRKVAGLNITYRDYQWAKVYPSGMKSTCKEHFAYIVGLSDSLHFHMMGVGNYQSHPLSKKASQTCWTELDINNFNYDNIANQYQFKDFDKKYRRLFVETGAGFGIPECIKIKDEQAMNDIITLLKEKGQVVLQGPPGTGKTYTAKDVAEKLIVGEVSDNKKDQKVNLESSAQFKLVQFHPSYTYEDFVRGIEANGTDTGIEYKTVEKILSKFARKAQENWENYHSNPEELYRKEWIQNKLDSFIESYSVKFANSADGKIDLTDMVYICQVDEDCFRYMGDTWAKSSRLNFSDLSKLIEFNLENPEELKFPQSISKHAYHRSSYYGAVLKDFFEKNEAYIPSKSAGIKLENFVLIIDELNRANLPSVLGELIYALEYRGESIDSMYEIDGSSKIQLPKNLFIIGTMNTADRSVGHIDYAIRRRFAFIDVLPSEVPISSQEGKELFKKVAKLFVKLEDGKTKSSDYLSPDFNYKEVQIGHSYFICDTDKLPFKLEYEIKPILREYLKDGILMSSAEELIEDL